MLMNVPMAVITVMQMPYAQIQREVLHVHAIPDTVETDLIVKVKVEFVSLLLIETIYPDLP